MSGLKDIGKIRVAENNRYKCRHCHSKIHQGESVIRKFFDRYSTVGWGHLCYKCSEEHIKSWITNYVNWSEMYDRRSSEARRMLRQFKKLKEECEAVIIAKELSK